MGILGPRNLGNKLSKPRLFGQFIAQMASQAGRDAHVLGFRAMHHLLSPNANPLQLLRGLQ